MALARVAPVALAAGRAAALSTSSPVARRPIAVAARRVDPSANLVALVRRSSSPGKLRHAAVATDAAPTAPPAADTLTYVDTHCHLDLIFQKMTSEAKKGKKGDAAVVDFDSWRNQLTQLEDPDSESYLGAQLEACLTVACSRRAMDAVRDILPKPGVFAAFGCHPLSAHEWDADMASMVESAVADENNAVVAVGECGLDYHYALKEIEADESLADDARAKEARWEAVRKTQEDVFVAQMKMATELGAPLVIHTREAEADTLRLMRQHLRKDARVHVHCFTSSASLARTLLGEYPNLCLGFTGVCTFKNGGDVREVVRSTPLDRILLETDGPYMAPAPHRGAVAHPGHVPHIAKKIAEVKGVRAEEVFAQCRANTRRTYGF